jgi:hypothetical protein
MWPFRRKDSLGDILDRIETVERKMTGLKLEWLEVLDKTQRWMQRSIKRADRASRDVEAGEAALSLTDGAVSGGPDPISAKILNERARGRNFRPTE